MSCRWQCWRWHRVRIRRGRRVAGGARPGRFARRSSKAREESCQLFEGSTGASGRSLPSFRMCLVWKCRMAGADARDRAESRRLERRVERVVEREDLKAAVLRK